MQTLQNKVTTLEIKVETLENRVRYLESGLEVSKYINDPLSKELDKHKLQQYFRWNCLIISSIPVKKNETMNNIKMAVEKQVATDIVNDYDLEFDKAHLVSRKRKEISRK